MARFGAWKVMGPVVVASPLLIRLIIPEAGWRHARGSRGHAHTGDGPRPGRSPCAGPAATPRGAHASGTTNPPFYNRRPVMLNVVSPGAVGGMSLRVLGWLWWRAGRVCGRC